MHCQHLRVSMPHVSGVLLFRMVCRFGIIRKLVYHLAPNVLLDADPLRNQAAQN
jgi:hypothetical protein